MFSISATKIDVAKLAAEMSDSAAGAFVSFEGWVRDSNDGHAVQALEYEVFPSLALSEGRKILEEAVGKFNLIACRTVHREGILALGDCAVWIGVTAHHRAEAFDACRYVIDEIKQRVPIWKKEYYDGLAPQWINARQSSQTALKAEDFYARQISLPEIGQAGQKCLSDALVLVVGVGGLGCAAALSLAASGVGTIGLAEHDTLHVSNLHRQTLYAAADIGKPKGELAAVKLKALNPLIRIQNHAVRIDANNVEKIIENYDVIVDCTDNFQTKYLLNDAAVTMNKILVQASLYRFEGQLLVIDPQSGAGCLRCLWPEPPRAGLVGDCAEAGVLGTLPAMMGALQANETIKKILGHESPVDLVLMDMLTLTMQKIPRSRNMNCAVCGDRAARPCFWNNIEYYSADDETILSLSEKFYLIDVREEWEIARKPIEHALHIPTSDFNDEKLNSPKDVALLLICAKGVRSLPAAEYLKTKGWNAFSLNGGIDILLQRKAKAA